MTKLPHLLAILVGTAFAAGCSSTDDGGASAAPSGSDPGQDAGATGDAGTSGDGAANGSKDGATGPTGDGATAPASLVFSPYKDTNINMNWNTNTISTNVSGSATPLATDLSAHGAKSITLAFATGECGAENWGGVPGAAMATANAAALKAAGIKYILSTGGAAGSFSCGTDAGMKTFIDRWSTPNLIGIDFDIEAGQSEAVIIALVQRIKSAHGAYPTLRFSLTLATVAASEAGSATAKSLGASAQDSFNVYGDQTLAAVKNNLDFTGAAASWPSYVTVNLMTMDYGSASPGNCVVAGTTCEMGQSAIQAAYNLHDKFGVPYSNIELTPMLGGNDASDEHFTLEDVDAVSQFAITNGLAGVHHWSYDRDTDCATGSASPTCNTMGAAYAGSYGFLKRFLAAGLH